MRKIPVIAFSGLAGSGKSTAAKYLETKGFVRTAFATPLRAMLRGVGLTDDELSGARKQLPCAKLSGRTPRAAMQLLGTEWGRALHPDLWINLWRESASDILDQDGLGVAVDDCRFENEANAARALGGFVVRIIRSDEIDDPVGIAGHSSESLDFDPDIIVVNDGVDLAAFRSSIDDAMAVLSQDDADEETR